MDEPIGQCLAAISTSRQWATLTSAAAKLNGKLPKGHPKVQIQDFAKFLHEVGADELHDHGVWVQWFGKGIQPIIVTNPACARARQACQEDGGQATCSCAADIRKGAEKEAEGRRYFGSSDYNAGRHAVRSSGHRSNCALWTPPTTSHLHSWRRGFD